MSARSLIYYNGSDKLNCGTHSNKNNYFYRQERTMAVARHMAYSVYIEKSELMLHLTLNSHKHNPSVEFDGSHSPIHWSLRYPPKIP
jgi:hypothetical protein